MNQGASMLYVPFALPKPVCSFMDYGFLHLSGWGFTHRIRLLRIPNLRVLVPSVGLRQKAGVQAQHKFPASRRAWKMADRLPTLVRVHHRAAATFYSSINALRRQADRRRAREQML